MKSEGTKVKCKSCNRNFAEYITTPVTIPDTWAIFICPFCEENKMKVENTHKFNNVFYVAGYTKEFNELTHDDKPVTLVKHQEFDGNDKVIYTFKGA